MPRLEANQHHAPNTDKGNGHTREPSLGGSSIEDNTMAASSVSHDTPYEEPPTNDERSSKPIIRPSDLTRGVWRLIQKRQKQEWSVITENPSCFVVLFSLTLSLLSREAMFLYGILAVLACHVYWVLLTWMDYIMDDQELRNFRDFMDGWSSFAIRRGRRIIKYDSNK